jgi:hypothetical protein
MTRNDFQRDVYVRRYCTKRRTPCMCSSAATFHPFAAVYSKTSFIIILIICSPETEYKHEYIQWVLSNGFFNHWG